MKNVVSNPEELPVKPGDRVRIPKGAVIRHEKRGESRARKSYTVTVEGVTSGMVLFDLNGEQVISPPSVVWHGDGGYPVEANVDDVEKLKDSSSET